MILMFTDTEDDGVAIESGGILTGADRLQLDRDAALHEVLTCTAGLHGLSPSGERDIRTATMRLFEPILQLADHATAVLAEYEALDGQLDRHVRTHPDCTAQHRCRRFRVLQIRRQRCWETWATAYRALIRGRR